MFQAPKIVEMPVGVVMRRSPGVTRWIAHVWTLAGIVPRAPAADWRMTRTDGIGDARIIQPADVWRTPQSLRARK